MVTHGSVFYNIQFWYLENTLFQSKVQNWRNWHKTSNTSMVQRKLFYKVTDYQVIIKPTICLNNILSTVNIYCLQLWPSKLYGPYLDKFVSWHKYACFKMQGTNAFEVCPAPFFLVKQCTVVN